MNSIAVPLMDPARGYRQYRDELDCAMHDVLARGRYILGPEVEAFERAFSQWCGTAHTVGVASGTDALHIALRTLGVGPGDIVFTVSHTAVATVAAIELAGAVPVLIDIDPVTYTIDVQKLEDTVHSLTSSGSSRRLRAVIAVHLYGHPCDLAGLGEICRTHGLFLIEDCAQAHGARLYGRRVGSIGDAAAFSFYPTKNLPAFGDGGAVCFGSKELAERCVALREYGWRERYISDLPGMSTRLDELQAAVLGVRLRHLDDEIVRRRRIAERYVSGFLEFVETPAVRKGCEHSFHLFVVRAAQRDAFRQSLQARGIGTGVHYPVPVHLQPAYAGRVPLGEGGLDVTETIARQIVSLPMQPFLTSEEVEAVIAAVQSWGRSRVAS